MTNFQTASLKDIESNDGDENRKFKFGGRNGPSYAYFAFGNTASAVVRMCILEAAGVPQHVWPDLGKYRESRNKGKLLRQVIKFDHVLQITRIQQAFIGANTIISTHTFG